MSRTPRAPKESIVKASVVGGGSSESAAEALAQLFSSEENSGNVVAPPYDFKKMYQLYEMSGVLRPNVEAYMTNIESFGHHFTPNIDLSAEEATERIADALYYEHYLAAQRGEDPSVVDESEVPEPSDDEVAEYKKKLRRVARLEYAQLKTFFDFAPLDLSFTELRRRTRQDLEVIGNAWWEVTRNQLGEVANFHYTRPIHMRLTNLDEDETLIEEYVRVTDISWRTVERGKRFRRFVMVQPNKPPKYFKEFGDPRIISRDSGKVYKTVEKMKKEEEKTTEPATEMIHWLIYSPDSIYGIPRWVPNLPAVLGSRELDEVNLNYFKNNVVPPLALLVSGGRFGKGVATKIEEFIEEHLKGRKGLHRILVLEAEGQKATGEPGPKAVPQVKFVPLRDVQQTDALFQNYDKRNEEKIGKSFRLPRILRGDDSAINRATAYASLRFAEEQVFEPERESFDSYINREIFPILGITFWAFRSNAPVTRDPEKMVDMVRGLVKDGILLPKEGRELASDIFNRQFIELSEDWTNRPLPMTLAQLRGPNNDPEPEPPAPEPDDMPDMPEQPPAPPQDAVRRAGTPLQALGE